MTVKRGQGKERTCPYCKGVYRNLPLHIPACDAVPSTEEVIDA